MILLNNMTNLVIRVRPTGLCLTTRQWLSISRLEEMQCTASLNNLLYCCIGFMSGFWSQKYYSIIIILWNITLENDINWYLLIKTIKWTKSEKRNIIKTSILSKWKKEDDFIVLTFSINKRWIKNPQNIEDPLCCPSCNSLSWERPKVPKGRVYLGKSLD